MDRHLHGNLRKSFEHEFSIVHLGKTRRILSYELFHPKQNERLIEENQVLEMNKPKQDLR